jgi:hypothetical protein
MTPADEATFIALWQQGLDTAEIAMRLGVRCTVDERVMNSYLQLMTS